MKPQELESRFLKHWQALKTGKLDGSFVYRHLRFLYTHPPRGYHNLENHINHCLTIFDETKYLAQDPEILEFAIWFHDAIYDTKVHGIEERCAALIYKVGQCAKLPEYVCKKAHALVLATRHIEIPDDHDSRLICDIDLSPLALPADAFERNSSWIREEYSWVPDKDFAVGRIKILKRHLDRPSIYLTPHFKDNYEIPARKNLTEAIEKLTKDIA